MSAEVAQVGKVCCKCGKNVAGKKRMKDHEGRYWCISCGEEDQKKKRLAAGGICSGCGDSFPESQLTEFGTLPYCKTCIKKNYAQPRNTVLTRIGAIFLSGTDKKRLFILLAIMLVIGLVVVGLNFYSSK